MIMTMIMMFMMMMMMVGSSMFSNMDHHHHHRIIVIFRSHFGSSPRLFRLEGVARRESSAGLLP